MTGTELREMRSCYRLSQSQLARLLGVDTGTVSRWERGALAVPPYLPYAVQVVGYQQIAARNQPILDRYLVRDLDAYMEELTALGLRGVPYALPMFDAAGRLIHWHTVGRDSCYAIGEHAENVDGVWRGYLIPECADPKPELRLPTLIESGNQTPALVRRLGRPPRTATRNGGA